MFALLRKYPLAIIASLVFHVAIVAALVVQVRTGPRQLPVIESDGSPIQAVAISEDQIVAEVERLEAEEDAREALAEEERQQRH